MIETKRPNKERKVKMEKQDIELIMLVANLAYLFIFIWDMKDGITVRGFDDKTQKHINIHFTDLDELKKWGNEYLENRDSELGY